MIENRLSDIKSSVLGAGSLYVVSSTIIKMVSGGSHHMSLPAGPSLV